MAVPAPYGHVCRDCKWFDGASCHRYPPQMILWPTDNQQPIVYEPHPTFAFVAWDGWCGEWNSVQ